MSENGSIMAELVRQLSTQLSDQRVMLATMAGDIKSVLSRQDQFDKQRDDHEQRIRRLEKMVWIMAAVGTAGGGAAGSAVTQVVQSMTG